MSSLATAVRRFLDLPDGARRLGPYRCVALLGEGGFAPVFRAVEEHGGQALREVAVKVFGVGAEAAHAGGTTGGYRARVLDEARALCRVQHPNVVRFFTLFEDPALGLLALVMEYVDGTSLSEQLADVEPSDAARIPLAVEAGLAVAAALAAAHQAGIVHCDVKPANIMFSQGVYKLIDFGIAALERPKPRSEVETRQVVFDGIPLDLVGTKASILQQVAEPSHSAEPISGTVGFIDPVCLRTTSAPTPSSDLYALGATLHVCLTGVVPAVPSARRRGEPGLDAAVLVGDASARPISESAADVPAPLAKLVDALLAPERERRPRSAEQVARELERIRSDLAGRRRGKADESRGPFRGLERFERGDRDVYFGRSAEVAGVVESLRQRGVVAVVGASGTGKSSLARAGVSPLVEEGALGWPKAYDVVICTPSVSPRASLTAQVREALQLELEDGPERAAQQLSQRVERAGRGVLLVLDQLEELATLHTPEQQRERLFVVQLLTLLADTPMPGVRALVTLRRDLLDGVLAIDPHFARSLARGMWFLAPLSGAAWEEVVDQALEAFDFRFEDAALREEVLGELRGRESAMPLVQFALTQLWGLRDAGTRTMTRAGYAAIGGIRGALEHHADATYETLSTHESQVARHVLLAMTTPSGTRAHVRAEALIERHGTATRRVLDVFVEARLVVREELGVTLGHESLLTEWPLLRGWLDEVRADRLLAEDLERDAARWASSEDPAYLWRRRRLGNAVELRKRGTVELSETALDFLQQSRFVRRSRRAIALMAVVASVLFFTRLDPLAPRASHFDAGPEFRLRPGADGTIRLRGARLHWFRWLWERRWLGALRGAGLEPTGGVTVSDDGSYADVKVAVPRYFKNDCLPLPRMPIDWGNGCAHATMQFRLVIGLVEYKDDDLPEVQSFFRYMLDKVRAHLPPNVGFDTDIRFERFGQNEFQRIAAELPNLDFIFTSPAIYVGLRNASYPGFSPEINRKTRPVDMTACSRRVWRNLDSLTSHSENTYRSLLITSPDSALARRLAPDERLTPAKLLAMRDLGAIKLFGTTTGSASGYIVPCLEWGGVFAERVHPYEWHFAGSPQNLIRGVLGEQGAIGVGAVNNGWLGDRVDGSPPPPHRVLWESQDLPHGGAAIVNFVHPDKFLLFQRALDETLQDLSAGRVALQFAKSSDTNAIGPCNDEAYRAFEDYLTKRASNPHCAVLGLGSSAPRRSPVGGYCSADGDCERGRCDILPNDSSGVCALQCRGDDDCTGGTRCFAGTCGKPLRVGAIHVGQDAPGDGWTRTHALGLAQAVAKHPYAAVISRELVLPNAKGPRSVAENVRQLVEIEHVDAIVATSRSLHDEVVVQARHYPSVDFLQFGAEPAKDKTQPNLGTFEGKAEQAWYVAGRLAAKKAKRRLGFVGAFPNPEVVRSINAFTLGARRERPELVVEVRWLGFWFDYLPDAAFDCSTGKCRREELLVERLADAGAEIIAHESDTLLPVKSVERLTRTPAPLSLGSYGRDQCFDEIQRAPRQRCLGSVYRNWSPLYERFFERLHHGTWLPETIDDNVAARAEDSVAYVALNATFEDSSISDENVRWWMRDVAGPENAGKAFEGPWSSTGQHAAMPAGQRPSEDEVRGMCWFVEGVVEKRDPRDPRSSDVSARVPDQDDLGAFPGARDALAVPGLESRPDRGLSCARNRR